MSASFLPSINGPAAPASAEVDVAQLMGDTLLRLINELPQGEGDQQGQISFNSFKAAVVSLGLATTEARRIFDHFDPDGTGFINFTELRSELTARVSERKPAAARGGRQAARLANSPFGGPAAGKSKGSSSSLGKGVSQGGIQRGLALSRSTGALIQPPSWDPVKARLDATPFKHAPLWRDDALDAGNGSKSLMRALASSGQLVRPSIKAFEEFEKERNDFYAARREENRKKADKVEMARSAKEERRARSAPVSSVVEDITFKNGEAEGFIGKIHDEELVEQQLDGAMKRMKMQIHEATLEAADPAHSTLERTLQRQGRVIEQRGNSLLAKANEVRAGNNGLKEVISKLRLERRLHIEFKEGLEARLAELNKLVPALVDQCNVLLFEGEKVQTKVTQTHQDAAHARMLQEESIEDASDQVVQTSAQIKELEELHYENEQSHAREMYMIAKESRNDVQTLQAKLGYLQWKTAWWVREFERLKGATGLELDFTALAKGGELDTQPIKEMMMRYSTQSADCASLERFLDTCTAEGNGLELELQRLRRTRADHEADTARKASTARGGGGHGGSMQAVETERAALTAKLDVVESLLREAFGPTTSMLQSLVGPADFAAAVREAEAIRDGKMRDGDMVDVDDEGGDDGAVDVSEGAEGEGSAPQSRASPPPMSPGRGRKSPVLGVAPGEAPSAMLAAGADELEAPHNSHRVKLVSDALDRCEHEILAVHDAARNFPKILDHLAHPMKSSKERLPTALQRWAGNPGDLEVKNVHHEFKRLAAEAEKRQREEAMREDAAAEEKKPGRGGKGLTPSKSAVPATKPSGAGAAATPIKGEGLVASNGGSVSMPTLSPA